MEKKAVRPSPVADDIHNSSVAVRSWRVSEADLNDPTRKKTYNRQLFAIVAPRYDVVTRVLSAGGDLLWKRRLLRMLPQRIDSPALDIATGTGDIAEALARRYPATPVIALDLNAEMLTRARSRLERFGKRVQLLEADMADIPLDSESVSVVTGGYALRNAPELSRALGEIARVLKPGGTAVFLEFSRSAGSMVFSFQFRLLRFWGQFWGLVLHGDPEVYAYIARSLAHFPDRHSFHSLLQSHGFSLVRSPKLYFGLLELTVVRKR